MTNTTIENKFMTATREALRFPFKGMISTEDLWNLSTTNLDKVFKTLNAERKDVQEESLLGVQTSANKELDLKIDIIKHIVSVKVNEANLRLQAVEQKEQKQKIMSILSSKQDENLQNKTVEELQAMLGELK